MLKRRLGVLIVLAVMVSACAAGRAYRRGVDAARAGDWEAAVVHYTRALQESPDNAQYRIELERAMQNAARDRIARAREYEQKDDLDRALLEYRRALEMDVSNRLAAARAAELERTIRDRIEKTRPRPEIERLREQARLQGTPMLNPASREPINVTFTNASLRDILNTLGEMTGINVQYDREFRDAAYTVALQGVTIEEALHQILSANQHFYKVLSPNTIIVAPDTPQAHQRYDDLVVRVFYLSHADPQEVSQIINTLMRVPGSTALIPALFPNKTANSLTVRATAPVMDVIERIIRANDKPRAEVVIDVQILEVNRTRLKQYGFDLSAYAVNLIFSPEVAPPNTSGFSGPPPPFNLNTISQGVSTADFYLGVPTAILRFLETDGHTRLLAKPQLRGAEGREMTLNLGQEVPVISTVFGAAAAGGFANIPQSSFTYRPVGINMSILPRVTYDGEIVLELQVENSALGPSIDVAGQTVPSFTSRRVTTKLRLREGESNLLAGLIREEDRRSLSGVPGVLRIPIINQLFASNNRGSDQTDIVMLLTPHIVRTHELTVDDLAPIYIGTQQSIGLTGPPTLIQPLPPEEPPPTGVVPPVSPLPGAPPPGFPGPPGAAAPGTPSTTPAPQPGTSPVPAFPTPPGTAPAGTPPATGETPPGTVPLEPGMPPRDPVPSPIETPGAPLDPTMAQVIVTTTSSELRMAGGPYLVPVSVNNVSRLSTLTLTVTFNPAVLRVRNVQEGTFMRQGAITASFTPRIDAAAGRVDIAVVRTGDQAGASGAGLLAALQFDAVGPGNSLIQISGIATTPEGTAIPLQFNSAAVTVR